MTTTIVLIRHGETLWNREGRIQGHSDSALTPVGTAQAEACANRLRDEEFDHVVASDLMRVRQTAELLLTGRNAPIEYDPAFRERAYGIGEGLTYAELDALHQEFVSSIRVTDPDFAVEGSESRRQFHTRVTSAMRKVAAMHAGRRVLIVTHGGVLAIIYRWLNRMHISSEHKVSIPNVAYNRVAFRGDEWKIEVWADTAHLDFETSDEA